MNVHDNARIVEIWMTNAEKHDPVIQTQMKGLYAQYKEKKYTVAVFHSGGGDLYQSTRSLLAYNKRRCAELTSQQTAPTTSTVMLER